MAVNPVVLMLGDSADWALAEIGKQLDARGVRWALLNTSDFPQRMTMDVRLESDGADWLGELVAERARVRLAEVSAVYYGKPTDFEFPTMSGPEQRFARAQARVGLGGVLASLPARWVSHPAALADSSYKPRQITLLRRAGLAVPPTLITNTKSAVLEFAAAYGDLAVKPLAEPIVWEGGGESVVYTRRLSAADLADLSGVDTTAHLFQQWQEKPRGEVRVVAVGDQLFAVAIHAGSDAAYIDWRADYDALTYDVIDVPDRVRAGIFRYLQLAGLASSVFDFVIGPDGWTAYEANGAGTWGWLAEDCQLPIAVAFADTLTKE